VTWITRRDHGAHLAGIHEFLEYGFIPVEDKRCWYILAFLRKTSEMVLDSLYRQETAL
jgi:hypothetical protein